MPGNAPAGTSTANDAGWATAISDHATAGSTLAIAARAGVPSVTNVLAEKLVCR